MRIFAQLGVFAALLLFVMSVGAQALELQVITATDILQKKGKKVSKVGKVGVGRKLKSSGKVAGGKFYKISIKGKEGFISAKAVEEINIEAAEKDGDVSAKSSTTGGSQLELGAAYSTSIGIAPTVGFHYAIPLAENLTIDPGIHASFFLLNPFIKQNAFSASVRFSYTISRISLSPELNFNYVMLRGVGIPSGSGTSFNYGFFAGIPLSKRFALVPGMRFSLSGGFSWVAYLNARFMF
jgi:hypothetical protein